MKRNDFWFWAVAVCFFIGVATKWILIAKILTIGTSVILLIETISRAIQLKGEYHGKK